LKDGVKLTTTYPYRSHKAHQAAWKIFMDARGKTTRERETSSACKADAAHLRKEAKKIRKYEKDYPPATSYRLAMERVAGHLDKEAAVLKREGY
jgi:hypothetical protein